MQVAQNGMVQSYKSGNLRENSAMLLRSCKLTMLANHPCLILLRLSALCVIVVDWKLEQLLILYNA